MIFDHEIPDKVETIDECEEKSKYFWGFITKSVIAGEKCLNIRDVLHSYNNEKDR